MIRLRTLGVPLLTEDGTPLTGPALQPRRIALLAVIASSGTGGIHRQELTRLFWSSHSAAATRHALAQWMFLVRRTLKAHDLFLGTTHITLNPKRIAVDVTEFDAAVARQDCSDAAMLYEGTFLTDFTLAGAPNFTAWLERARLYRTQSALHAVATLARDYDENGSALEAVESLKRWVTLDPTNTKAVMRLANRYDSLGDSNAALSVATAHVTRLNYDIGIDPPPELVTLIDRLDNRHRAPLNRPTREERTEGDAFLHWVRERLAPRFVVEGVHHQTSLATFFTAHRSDDSRPVRIKAYLPDLVQTADKSRLLFLLRAASGLHHPAIDSPDEVESFDGTICAILSGSFDTTLRDRLVVQARLSMTDANALGTALAHALEYVHRCGGTHGDIMPRRVTLRRDGYAFTDVGVVPALELCTPSGRFDAGMGLGAVAYMSPERLTGEHEIQCFDDIYSLGCLLHHAILGEPPHYETSTALIIRNRLSGGRLAQLARTTAIPKPIRRMLSAMLNRSGSERPTAADVRGVFQEFHA